MLLNAVIITLREVLEASLIISVFLALSQLLERKLSWLLLAMFVGAVGGFVYGQNLGAVSMAWDGMGQELVNAGLHLLIFLSLLVFMISVPHQHKKRWRIVTLLATITAVVVAITREGSEIILYFSGAMSIPNMLLPVLIGSIVGAGIGISVGIYFYYLLINMRLKYGMWLGYLFLLLVAGSMISQAIEFLIQADFIHAGKPLWDSSILISERSVIGQLLYALVGYEATPAPIQVVAYVSSITIIAIATVISYQFRIPPHDD
ncbi:High-affinity iron permease [Methylophaga thiooxydans]|uniref:High-affinity iron permease n=1 Tax=Methylophaga thiooxydans TaxID=392484 RepID=A0A0A0BGK0_9GAMM|nr:FTR1 family protein [Methylophaga thiooxydans]KGM06777.1 High-affinity iron permease [Methylophaga thiooxydans]